MVSSIISRLHKYPKTTQFLIFLTLGIAFAANIYGSFTGITIVIPHLFYIPIILAAFFYPRRGVPFAAGLCAAYLLMIALVYSGNSPELLSAAARCVVFILVAAVVSYLSLRVSVRETELTKVKDEWERTFDTVPDLIALISRDHRILRVNRAMAESLGVSPEQAVGMLCYDVVHHSSAPPLNCPHAMLLKDGREHTGEVHEDNLGGDFLVTASPLYDADGGLIGSVHVARDITERKRIETALRDSGEILKQQSQVLSLKVRELNCLYEIARLVETSATTDALFQSIADILPSAGQYPDLTCARVVVEGREFLSTAFLESNQVGEARIIAHNRFIGKIEIFFRGDNTGEKLPVPSGETDLLSAIAERVGRILERKEAEEALHESEVKYRSLVESSFDGIAIHQNGTLVYVNQTGARLLGAEDPAVFIGRPAIDIVAPAFRKQVAERVQKASDSALALLREQFLRLDGTPIDVDVATAPSIWKGRPAAYVTFRDITAQVRAEESLRESEEKYRAIINEMQDIFYRTDNTGKIIMLSPSAAKLAGYDSLDQLLGNDVSIVYANPADRNGLLAAMQESGSVYAFPIDLKVRDGSIRHVTTSSHFYRDSQGIILGIEGVIHDITNLRQAEDALRESEERYRTIIENIQDVYFRIDREHRLVMLSPSAAPTFGYPSAETMLGIPIVTFWKNPEQRAQFIEAMAKQGGIVQDWEAEFKKSDGTQFWVSITARMRTDRQGGFLGTEGIIRDISERKKMEDALKNALTKLNMLSSITRHDILNQITGLRTFLELSREDLKGTKFETFVEKEDQAAEAVQRQIEFTRYYQDIGVNAPKWQDAGEVIRDAAQQISIPAIDLQINIGGVEIYADPLIVKVFFNLIENSLRHGKRVTQISFSSRTSAEGLIITYRDNGAGISAEDKKKLFQKGFGKHTGLGLFLSREILAITGITITENGEPGKGVQFEITVPNGGFRDLS